MKHILLDIEGTTTPIDFVHKTLFPYSARKLPEFVEENSETPEVKPCLAAVNETVLEETGTTVDTQQAIAILMQWIEQDRKHPALKQIQGMIWKHGYETGAFVSAIYDDVLPAIDSWIQSGHKVGIYSSGSVQAQKLLFGHTPHGDLQNRFSYYFDTEVGHKREAKSYVNILKNLDVQGSQVLFLSDVCEELDAARECQINTVQIVRPGTQAGKNHSVAQAFDASVIQEILR